MSDDDKKPRAGILIVSTTASSDPESDRSTKVLLDVFENEGAGQWDVIETTIVPDDVLAIQRTITQWTDRKTPVNLIVTSGGTGFTVKDVTPEPCHAFGVSVRYTVYEPFPRALHEAPLTQTVAAMSRPVAGVRNRSLILTLPGSPKGAQENLASVIKLLRHAVDQAAGADSRALHQGGVKQLERDAGLGASGAAVAGAMSASHKHSHHHHDHGHGGHTGPKARTDESDRLQQSNDPSLGPSRRHRSSPYPMLSVSEALTTISENIPAPTTLDVVLSNSVVGHVLAADVKAVESVPAFRASIVDGYAVRFESGRKTNRRGVFPIAFASHAQAGKVIPELKAYQIARITTGAPLPLGANAVVMVEDTVLKSMTDDGREEAEVEILTDEVEDGENVREAGSDVKSGDIVMRRGEGITAIGGEFGLLASVGTKSVGVYRKPIVGVLSTGDEIVEHDRPGGLELGEVRDTNRPTLLTAIKAQGFEAVDLGIASDKANALEDMLRTALLKIDVLITSGGVSMGELDLLKPTIERSLGGTIHFGRVSMKPGKPTTFATIPGSNFKDPATGKRGHGKRVVFGLPGNPASAVVTFMLFVLPALHQISGIEPVGLPRAMVRLETSVKCDKVREEYHRVVVSAKAGEDGLWALSTGGQRSSRIGSFKAANALLKLPAGGGTIEKGSRVEALLMGPPAGMVEAATS